MVLNTTKPQHSKYQNCLCSLCLRFIISDWAANKLFTAHHQALTSFSLLTAQFVWLCCLCVHVTMFVYVCLNLFHVQRFIISHSSSSWTSGMHQYQVQSGQCQNNCSVSRCNTVLILECPLHMYRFCVVPECSDCLSVQRINIAFYKSHRDK